MKTIRTDQVSIKHGNVFALLLPVLLLFSCTIKDDNGALAPTAPGQNTNNNNGPSPTDIAPIVLCAAESSFVRLNDTMAITVLVVDTLTMEVLPAVQVIAVPPLKGRFIDDTVVTDADGRAVFGYIDSVQGRTELRFRALGAESVPLRFDVTDTPDRIQKLLEILPERPSIKADAVDFTDIVVRVINADHNPIIAEPVHFITSSGVIIGSDPDSSGNSGISLTDNNGEARAKLISTNINDTAYVTAYLVNNWSMSGETQVVFQGVSIQITTDSSNLSPGQSAFISAQVLNASNVPIVHVPVYFSLGKGDNSNLSLDDYDTVTGFDGKAWVTVTGEASGSDSILVIAAGARSSVKLNVTDLSLRLSLDASVLQARSDIYTRLTVDFMRQGTQPLGNKLVRLVRHYKTASRSDTTDTLESRTSSAGQASFSVYGVDYDCVMRLEVTGYNSSTDMATAEGTVTFITTRQMTIQALPTIVQADGSSRSQIVVQIKNENNNPIVGDVIEFTTDVGWIDAQSTTGDDGKATAYLTSDRRNATATVTATLQSDHLKTATIRVDFTGVELSVQASPPSIRASWNDTCYIIANLVDATKNPIVGERINFSPRLREITRVAWADSLTNNRGEARAKIVGAGESFDTIRVDAAGDSAVFVVYYSSNYLVIDTASASGAPHSYVANGTDSTRIRVYYLESDSVTRIPGAPVEVSVTLGSISGNDDTLFAGTGVTDGNGVFTFYVKNPSFANTATIFAKAFDDSEVTAASKAVYFKSDLIHHIKISGTPEVVSTNGGRARITAVAFDARGNRVKDADVTFNLLSGPGGGEHIDPPTVLTAGDGSATTYLIAGSIPSKYREVRVVAGDFNTIKSDTAKFTISGPPHNITVRHDMGDMIDNGDGTYSLACAALVTDVNGNPVADGTEVTFSIQVCGYRIYYLDPQDPSNTTVRFYSYDTDTVANDLWFEDLNDNLVLDPGEDVNHDGVLQRGEDRNGNGRLDSWPPFEDINRNGRRDRMPELRYVWETDHDTVISDLNGNNMWDFREPLLDATYLASYNRLLLVGGRSDTLPEDWSVINTMDAQWEILRSAIPGGEFDMDWNSNGVIDPNTAVSIERTIQTGGGKAPNLITYGQSDALRIWVQVTAEAGGKTTINPDRFLLPILEDDLKYWSAFK